MFHNNDHNDERTSKDDDDLRRLLAARSYHLPGNGWCGDWIQWMRNNHPLFGICCKYRQHPVGIGHRIILLLGSVSFGIAATNLVFLYYHLYEERNGTLLTIYLGDNNYELTYEMIVVWTLGSFLHSIVDLAVWHLAACSWCMPGGIFSCCQFMRIFGSYMTIIICAVFLAFGIWAILMRANYEEANGTTTIDELTDLEIQTIQSFSFLVGYFVELALAYFVYFPIMGTVMFSGMLRRCFPCLGGRQKEVDRYDAMKKSKLNVRTVDEYYRL